MLPPPRIQEDRKKYNIFGQPMLPYQYVSPARLMNPPKIQPQIVLTKDTEEKDEMKELESKVAGINLQHTFAGLQIKTLNNLRPNPFLPHYNMFVPPKTPTIPQIPVPSLPILRVLGSGGFGIVYASLYENKTVAVKKYKVGRSFLEDKDAFDQELNAFRKIGEHPNCIGLLGYCCEPETRTLALVLELAEFGSLQSEMDSEIKLTAKQVLPIMVQIAAGLKHLHDSHLAHRDIKPDNVLISSKDPLVVKLADFGLLRTQNKDSTKLRTFAGTPYYLSPELDWDKKGPLAVSGPFRPKAKVDYFAADVWALGIMMLEICNGGMTSGDLDRVTKLAREGGAPIRQVATRMTSHLPLQRATGNVEWVAELITKCLRKLPASRPKIAEIHDTLVRWNSQD